MKRFLIFLILVQFVTHTFSLDLSIVRGLNLKNALMYAALLSMIIKIGMSTKFHLEMPRLQGAFFTLVGYGVVSYLVKVLVDRDPDYDAATAAIFLKSALIDYLVVFLTFFYGVRTLDDALDLTKALLAGMVFANVVTVLDVTGVLGLNIIPVRDGIEDGRVQGALGEANQYAAIIVMLLPGTAAMVLRSTGIKRLFWMAGVLFAVTALLMTISRGAMVGLVIGGIAAALMLRRFVSAGKVLKWVGVAAVLLTLTVIALSASYGHLMYERLIVSTFMSDGVDATSGRNWVWAAAVGRMAESPWTFLTGFGYSAYFFMPFEFGTHNDYLKLWFELGLPGLLSFLAIHFFAIMKARDAVMVAPAEVRPLMIAFFIGWIAVCISVFFVNLIDPSIYMWAYLGVSMRLALCVLDPQRDVLPESRSVAAESATGKKNFGWVAPTPLTGNRAARGGAGANGGR